MPIDLLPYGAFFAVIALSHLVQAVTGFGAIVLALPVLTVFFPLKLLIPSLVAVNLVQSTGFALWKRRCIDPGQGASLVLLSLTGLPLGYALYRFLPARELEIGLGVLVCVVSLARLSGWRPRRSLPAGIFHLLNFGGGVLQGALGSGGPLLVLYAAYRIHGKSAFRATLSLTWAVLNAVLCLIYTAAGGWSASMAPLIGLGLTGVAAGTLVGIRIHDRIPQELFRRLVFGLLLLTGLVLFWKGAG